MSRARQLQLLGCLGLLACRMAAQVSPATLCLIVRDALNRPIPGVPVRVVDPSSLRAWNLKTDSHGDLQVSLPQGAYRLEMPPGERLTDVLLSNYDISCNIICQERCGIAAGPYRPPPEVLPAQYAMGDLLLTQDPEMVAESPNTGGFGGNSGMYSRGGLSWTGNRFNVEGMNVTDPYQPGVPLSLPPPELIAEARLSSAQDDTSVRGTSSDLSMKLAQAGPKWHAAGGVLFSGRSLAWKTTLPTEWFDRLSRTSMSGGGPLRGGWDLLVASVVQASAQEMPVTPPATVGTGEHSVLLRAGKRWDRSRLDLIALSAESHRSGWALSPAADVAGPIDMPGAFNLVPQLAERDLSGILQAGWTMPLHFPGGPGLLQIRGSYTRSTADRYPTGSTSASDPTRIELTDETMTGSPPFWSKGNRQRKEVRVDLAFHPAGFLGIPHRIAFSSAGAFSTVGNEVGGTGSPILAYQAGQPAFLLQLQSHRPGTSSYLVKDAFWALQDRIALTRWMWADAAIGGDASYAIGFAPAWRSASPRIALGIAPLEHHAILRAGFARLALPFSARYLDYGNPSGLGILKYRWDGAVSSEGPEASTLLERSGSLWSSIDPGLRRPYVDTYSVGAELRFSDITFRCQLFRQDEDNRIAAVNKGIPADAWSLTLVHDPGPDGMPGTWDDLWFTPVYAQNPSTFGKDWLELTNPPGLRMFNSGAVGEIRYSGRFAVIVGTYAKSKSFGATNPGNTPWQNDPDVPGVLFQNPNNALYSTGHTYFDHSNVGKVSLVINPPRRGWPTLGIVAIYTDGLPFDRRFLVEGLPQGPFLVNTTLRGSPEGGNRAEHMVNTDARLSRAFAVRRIVFHLSLDVLNVFNGAGKWRESDTTSADFNSRVPLAVQPPRSVRGSLSFSF